MDLEFKLLQASGGLKYAGGEGKPVTVEGYASVFNTAPDSYGDVIAPGAYAKTLTALGKAGRSLPLRYEHYDVVGKWVDLREDRQGLVVKGELTPGHSIAENVAASLRHGAVTGLSIGYRAIRASRDAKGIRTLEEIDLAEVSIVANPAQTEARISAAKAAGRIHSVRDFEKWLCGLGFSRNASREIASNGFKAYAEDRASFEDDEDEHREAVERVLADLRAVKM